MAETAFHQSAQFRFLGVSAGNVFGKVGPSKMVYVWGKQGSSSEVGGMGLWLRTAGEDTYPSRGVGPALWLPGFSGEVY